MKTLDEILDRAVRSTPLCDEPCSEKLYLFGVDGDLVAEMRGGHVDEEYQRRSDENHDFYFNARDDVCLLASCLQDAISTIRKVGDMMGRAVDDSQNLLNAVKLSKKTDARISKVPEVRTEKKWK